RTPTTTDRLAKRGNLGGHSQEAGNPPASRPAEGYESDGVSALSGIGNESVEGLRRREEGGEAEGARPGGRARAPPALAGGGKGWTQEELDDLISRNEWGSVARYINKMRAGRERTTAPPVYRQGDRTGGRRHGRVNGGGERRPLGGAEFNHLSVSLPSESDLSKQRKESEVQGLEALEERECHVVVIKQLNSRTVFGWIVSALSVILLLRGETVCGSRGSECQY
ncbi:hypothetical protein THAOC_00892, partial [Thalassiosira oceanica]